VVVTANRNPEIARLLSEVCEAAQVTPLLSAVDGLSPTVEQLQCELTRLNRSDADGLMVSFISFYLKLASKELLFSFSWGITNLCNRSCISVLFSTACVMLIFLDYIVYG